MKKKILSIVLVFALVFSNLATIALAAYPGEEVQVQVNTDKSSVQKDEEFTLTVSFDKDIIKLGNLMIKMDYDESKVSFVSAQEGGMGRNAEDLEEAGNKFVVFLWETDTSGVDYTAGTVAYSVTFKATAAGTAANIAPAAVIASGDFADATLEQNDIPFTIQNATVELTLPAQTVTVTGDPSKTYDGSPVTDPAVDKDSEDGTVTYKYYTNEECTAGETSTPPTNAGSYWVKATVSGSSTHADATSAAKAFTIGRAGYSYSYTGTTTATVGSAMPATDNGAKAAGVGSEEVAGTLAWYTDGDCTASASGTFADIGTETLYWKFTPAETEINYSAEPQTGSVTFTVTALPSQVFADGFTAAETKTYGNAAFTRTASLTTGNGDITYSSGNEAVATVDNNTGEVTIQGAGTAVITATAAQTAAYAETSVSYTLTVNPKALTADDLEFDTADLAKIYDGTTNSSAKVKVKDASLVKAEDVVTVPGTAVYNSKDVTSANKITFTTNAITAGNYSLADGLTVTITSTENENVKIVKRSVTVTVDEVQRPYGQANPTFTGRRTGGMPFGEGDTYDDLDMTFYTASEVDENSNVGTYHVYGDFGNPNYTGTVIGTDKLRVVPAAPTYVVDSTRQIKKGSALSVFTSIAPAKATGVGGADVAGAVSWYSDSENSTPAQEGDVSGLAVGSTVTLYWKFAPSNTNYKDVTGSTTFEIVDGDPQNVTFTSTTVNKVYGDAAFDMTASNDKDDGGAITYSSSNPAVAKVNASTGNVEIVGAGNAVITAKAAAVDGKYAEGTGSYTLVVAPKPITVTVKAVDRKFGEENPAFEIEPPAEGTLVGDDTVNGLGLGLKTTATSASNVGTYDVEGDGEYDVNYAVTIVGQNKLTVKKADAPLIQDQVFEHKYSQAGLVTKYFPELPADRGDTSYYPVWDSFNFGDVLDGDPKLEIQANDGRIKYNLKGQSTYTAGVQATFKVEARMQNYETVTVLYTIRLVDKNTPDLDVEPITVVYTGEPVSKDLIDGTATFGEGSDKVTVEGSWKWEDGQDLTDVADSGNKTVVFVPEDTDEYKEVKTTVLLTIEQAEVTGEPSITEIRQAGKTLADAELSPNTLDPSEGVLTWDDPEATVVVRNTEYGWTFTPDDPNYAVKTGVFTPFARVSGSDDDDNSASDSRLESEFWHDVQRQINACDEGDVIDVNAKGYDQMPWYVMRDLKDNGVGMRITWNGGREIYIPAGKALEVEAGRVYYPLSYLVGRFNTAPDQLINPVTGGVLYTMTAPDAAGEILASTPATGGVDLALDRDAIASILPEAPADTMPAASTAASSHSGMMLAAAAALAVLAAAGVLFLKKRREN